jgi:hypothetical protein
MIASPRLKTFTSTLALASLLGLASHEALAKKALPQIFETAQRNAALRACLDTVPAKEDKEKWRETFGWPLISTITSSQLEALLELPKGSAPTLGRGFAVDCSKPNQPPHSTMFTKNADGTWSISGFM